MKGIFGIINGNSDSILDKLIESGVTYDLVLTDPPYNINKDFGNDSDSLSLKDFLSVTKDRIHKLHKLLTPNGSIIWFGIHDYIGFIQVIMYEEGLSYRRLNIWHYKNGFSRSKIEPATHYEPFLWFSNSSKKWTYNYDEVRIPYKSTERLKSPVSYYDSKGEKKIWKPSSKGSLRGDVWNFPTLAGNAFKKERTVHPTQKPESLITELIKAFCPMKDGHYVGKILDPFHGSGTLGICCEKLNREGNNILWTGVELEKKWCNIANERLKHIDETLYKNAERK